MSETRQGVISPILVVLSVVLLIAGGLLIPRPEALAAPIVLWGEGASPSAISTGAKPKPAPAATATPAPPIKARVGLQVGHWESEELPDELAILRTEHGANAGGVNEVDINYAIAQRVADLLRARGITVDILPATVPSGYTADAFIAIHSDYNNSPTMNGFKLARFRDSASPAHDDALLSAITVDYGAATGQPRDGYITRAMTGYYAFNNADFQHAIAPQTPGVIIELGFLTNPTDRTLLTEQQATVATGLAAGIIRFLTNA
ncbi:MAG TPA: N-acetylmuramoyl-L-alanine amidase [Thermomicrobiales bacterium]